VVCKSFNRGGRGNHEKAAGDFLMNEEVSVDFETRQRGFERFILLVLGSGLRKISMLHIEKEIFLLWNFHPAIRSYLKFVKHLRGPYSTEIEETIINPMYFENLWEYVPPKKGDMLSGGHIQITEMGVKEFQRFEEKLRGEAEAKRRVDLLHLLAGIKMVRGLYDELSLKELLLLIYDTYPDFIEKSEVYTTIEMDKPKLAHNLLKKRLIDEDRFNALF